MSSSSSSSSSSSMTSSSSDSDDDLPTMPSLAPTQNHPTEPFRAPRATSMSEAYTPPPPPTILVPSADDDPVAILAGGEGGAAAGSGEAGGSASREEAAADVVPTSIRNVLSRPGNSVCIDCGAPNPRWASLSYGTFFCLECSGLHRSLGVQISFVRSVDLDTWYPSQLLLMALGGNSRAYAAFAAAGWDAVTSDTATLKEKYASPAAAAYRAALLDRVQDAIAVMLKKSNAELFPAFPHDKLAGADSEGDDALEPESPAVLRKVAVPLQARAHDVENWSSGDLRAWLDIIGLPQYAQAFTEHAIVGSMLADLAEHSLLKDMGIATVGHRIHIIRAIRLLTHSTAASGPTSGSNITDAEYVAAATAAAIAATSTGSKKSKRGRGRKNSELPPRPRRTLSPAPSGSRVPPPLSPLPRGSLAGAAQRQRRASVDVSALSLNRLMEGVALPGHDDVSHTVLQPGLGPDGRPTTSGMAGYLFKQATSLKKGWQKRWFTLKGYVLSYYKSKEAAQEPGSKPSGTIPTMGREVRRTPRKGQFAFVLSHAGTRDYFLRAPSEAEMHKWITTLVCDGLCTTEEGGTSDFSSRAHGPLAARGSRSRSPSAHGRADSTSSRANSVDSSALEATTPIPDLTAASAFVFDDAPDWSAPGTTARRIVRDGILELASGTVLRSCHAVLTNYGMVVTGQSDNSMTPLDLAAASVKKGAKGGKHSGLPADSLPRAFTLSTPAGSFVFVAASKEAMRGWITALETVIADLVVDS